MAIEPKSQMTVVMKEIKAEMRYIIKLQTICSILRFVHFKKKSLWGTIRPRGFKEGMVMLTIYKDLYGIGYVKLQKKVKEWANLSVDSLHHNICAVRIELRRWANNILKPLAIDQLIKSARKTERPPPCSKVTFWIDSSDFKKKGKRSVHKKKYQWSQKLKGPWRRWITICDAFGRTQFVGGPHWPTEYDGDLTIHYAMKIDSLFSGTTMIGDNHFRKATSYFKQIELITPKSHAGRPKMVKGKKVKIQLTKDEEKVNEIIVGIRGKVEAPYGWIKRSFSALSTPFYEDEIQHDCVVRFALACHRLCVSK
jgi:hypothetical protein